MEGEDLSKKLIEIMSTKPIDSGKTLERLNKLNDIMEKLRNRLKALSPEGKVSEMLTSITTAIEDLTEPIYMLEFEEVRKIIGALGELIKFVAIEGYERLKEGMKSEAGEDTDICSEEG